ncbi:integrase, catalytic region, zinc finger, CCHC-type containing protein, partial [Tanacetum coccineum]
VEPIYDANVKHTLLNANSQLICVTCKQCMFDANHDVCFLDVVNEMNMGAQSKSKSNKKSQPHNIWKPTGKIFSKVGLKWKPTRRTFTLVGNACPLTRITSTKIVPRKNTPPHSVETPKPELKVYSRRPKHVKNIGLSKKAKIVEPKIANNSEPNHSWGSYATNIPSSSSLVNDRLSRLFSGIWTPDFGNDQIAKIMGYGDYQIGNVTISRVYYVEGLGHNLFLVGQFCDSDLEVAFRKHTYFIRNLEGVDLLSGSQETNLYTLSIRDVMVKFLASKNEDPDFIIKFLNMIQVRLNATVRNIRTDNGTEFVNQTLHSYYESVGISHETSVGRTPQQNGVVERRNRTLVKAARTMLIYTKALLFLWAEAVATAC